MSYSISNCVIRSADNEISTIISNWPEKNQSTESSSVTSKECLSKVYTITENILAVHCSEKVDISIQKQIITEELTQIRQSKKECKIKIFSLIKICDVLSEFGDEDSAIITIDLFKPPQLISILKYCENIFDWLAKCDENIAILYFNTDDESILLAVILAYSCYYDSMFRRDIRQSVAIKSFLANHSKSLEKVPVSFRRYAGYMSLYSCLNQLQSLRSSINLYCLILYNFPTIEINKTSQLFFKIYTNAPMKCSHTTKLYCLPQNVNRLVILFDQYPILLRNDTMIICYHRSIAENKRTKILRLNFHTCQATGDILTFYSEDFEDLYSGCTVRMKLDLYLHATAVFGQGALNFSCDTGHTQSTELERCDSYQSLSVNQMNMIHSHKLSSHHEKVMASSSYRQGNVIQEMEEVKTETNVISSSETTMDEIDHNYGHKANQNEHSTNINTRQLKDVFVKNNSPSTDKVQKGNSFTEVNQKINMLSNAASKETQLLSELLEAQKEIWSLRQSMNCTVKMEPNTSSPLSLVKDTSSGRQLKSNTASEPMPDAVKMDDYSAHKDNLGVLQIIKESYSGKKTGTNQCQQYHLESHNVTEEEQFESVSLQPIGIGVHDLNKTRIQTSQYGVDECASGFNKATHSSLPFIGNVGSQSSMPIRENMFLSKYNSHHDGTDNKDRPSATTLSDVFLQRQSGNVSLEFVERNIQLWYQPDCSRDEATAVLKQSDPGHFIIRGSSSFAGSYGLAVKVASIPPNIIPQSDDLEAAKVRHFLIEQIPNLGFRIKGFPEEPMFPSLTHLVQFYSNTVSILPCLLVLSEESTSMNQNIKAPPIPLQKTNDYNVLYLGCYDADMITGPSNINKAIERLLTDMDPSKYTECLMKIRAGHGIELIDVRRKLFFKRIYSFSDMSFCAIDRINRNIDLEMSTLKDPRKLRLFGIIIKGDVVDARKCFLFSDLDPNQTANTIVKIICENLQKSNVV